MHRIYVDRPRALVCSTASGYFTLAALETAAAELHAAIRSLGSKAGEHVTLYDYRDVKVGAAPVLERLARYFTDPDMAPLQARRVAFVSSSALLTMQLQRIQRPHMRLFTDRAEATSWLLADQDRARTTAQPIVASA